MTTDAFLENLVKKFPQLGKDAELQDIADLVKAYSDSSRMKLWDEFRDTYTNVGRPNRAVFATIAGRLGLSGNSRPRSYENFCIVCEAFYPMESACCPKCKNSERGGYVLVFAGRRPNQQKIDEWKRAFHPGPHPRLGNADRKGPMANKVGLSLAAIDKRLEAEPDYEDEPDPYWDK